MTGTRRFNTGIAARDRIYLANDNRVYAFTMPVAGPTVVLTNITLQTGVFQFGFTNLPGQRFTAVASTNLFTASTNWVQAGPVAEIAPGQFQFKDMVSTNVPARFYRAKSP